MLNETLTREHGDYSWRPDDVMRSHSRLQAFIKFCGAAGWEELQRRSANDAAWFTEYLLRFLDVEFSPPFSTVLDVSQGVTWSRWCVGGGLNISQRCLDYHRDTPVWKEPAIIWEGEEGEPRVLSYEELHRDTECCAAGLRARGLKHGDRIALHLPMMPETVIALLAIARIGAIGVPLFSGYGAEAIRVRLQDVEARCLITCDGFFRRGALVDAKATIDRAIVDCPCIEQVVVVSNVSANPVSDTAREYSWRALLRDGERAIRDAEESDAPSPGAAAATKAEDALLILYTSGTTGKPKGVIHSHCGFPIKAAQDMAFGTDVGPQNRICWITDIGWMMGPWLIFGATILGATQVLLDGAPDYPAAGRLWSFCARHRIEILGVSPSLIRALASKPEASPDDHDLTSLRILASTGESWDADSWDWFFQRVGKRCLPIINYSGGTEISGGILMSNPLLPQKPCAFSAACPGMNVDVLDENGQSIQNGIGELVVRGPWIGMARGFWRDPERYLETYWSRWPGVWVHGDWASTESDGQWYIYGRSDDTLKVAGKRVGPGEVESVVLSHAGVREAAVVGVPDERKGSALLVFAVLALQDENGSSSHSPDNQSLGREISELIGVELGKPMRPREVHFVTALPKTRNGKVMRRLLRAIYLGECPGDISALENVGILDLIRQSLTAS